MNACMHGYTHVTLIWSKEENGDNDQYRANNQMLGIDTRDRSYKDPMTPGMEGPFLPY